MKKRDLSFSVPFIVIAFLISACGAGAQTQSPQVEPTVSPVPTQTSTPEPTSTPTKKAASGLAATLAAMAAQVTLVPPTPGGRCFLC